MQKGDMLKLLAETEDMLRESSLLDDPDHWQSLDVNYEPPRVERLWAPLNMNGTRRVYLHRISCECVDALFHPHPWPSAVKLLSGGYQMGVGFGAGDTPPPVAATIYLATGSTYEMIHPDAWHYVKPSGIASLSVMVTDRPWERWAPKSPRKLGPLTEETKKTLLEQFHWLYHSFPETTRTGTAP